MNLLSDLMDQGLVDSDGERCGRVDDIEVEDVYDRPARLVALLSGGGAKSRHLWRPLHRLSLWIHAALGQRRPVEPARVAWADVERIEGDVFLRRGSEELDLDRLNRAVAERIIRHIPGAS